jgi:hypothetical protein
LDSSHDDLSNLVEPPKPLLLEQGDDDDDIVEVDMGLSHEVYDVYTSPTQAWIDEVCSGACHFWHEFDHAHGFMFCSSQSLMDIPTCMYLIFDVSLFWLMTKHKGRSHGIHEMLKWLHWIYNFT